MGGSNDDVGLDNVSARDGQNKVDLGDVFMIMSELMMLTLVMVM